MSRRNLKALLFAATSGVALAAGVAQAQVAPLPPEHYTMDPRGVDLVSGDYPLAVEEVVIGQPGNGLSYGRVLLDNIWRDVSVGGIACSWTGSCMVAVDGVSEEFEQTSPGVFTSTQDVGSSLVLSGGVYIYTRAGGTVWRMSMSGVSRYGFDIGVSRKDEPNGLRTEYNYTTAMYCAEYDPEGNCSYWDTASKIRSYQTNTGYQIHYEYAADSDPTDGAYYLVTKVTGINTAVDYCYVLAASCTGLTRVWPSVTYSWSGTGGGQLDTVTDQSGRATQYQFLSGSSGPTRLKSVTLPGMSIPQVDLTWDLGSGVKVSRVVGPAGQWDYTFADSGTTRTATVAGPLGQGLAVVSDLTMGRATSVTDALSHTWSYQYDAGQRLQRVTNPEGDYSQFTYDSRGNITQATYVAKPGSGLSNIITSATYPSTCASPVTCNSPITTTDARGSVTDYTWNATHGGLLTMTAPAPTGGAVRPQTRVSYGSFYAYGKTGSGGFIAWPTPVTLPTQTSACATGASCTNAANEVRTTLTYGSIGVANNLHPTTIARGSGASPTMSVTAMTYTPDGDVETVDGPLAGSADVARYRYDAARQVVGVVGPDPDGGGAGLNRAQRMTYSARGQVTLSETGTTPGYTDPNWASFSPLVRSATVYDDKGRPVVASQQSGTGTPVGVQQVSYDAAGRPECAVVRMNPAAWGALPASACTATTTGSDGPDRITRTTYDVTDRPLSATSAYGRAEAATTSQTYTANGQIASLTDGNGNVSIQQYDGFDRPTTLRYPNATGGGTSTSDYEQVAYDAYGRVVSSRNRAGQVTTLTLDNLGRVTAVDAPAGTMDVAYTYDNLGRVLTSTGNGQTLTTAWDPLSRQTSESGPLGTMSYQYDSAGRQTRITWPDAFYAQYDHDVSGAVTAIRENGAGSGAGVLATYAYNNLGQPTAITRGNGTVTAYGYDAAGRMTGLSHDMAGSAYDIAFGYAWNPAGQIASRTVSNAAYVYAPATGSTSYASDGLNRVTSAGGTAVTYDPNQNTTGALGSTYGYDAANRLTSATIGGTGYAFGYDPSGRLYSGGGYFQYVGAQLASEYNGSGLLVTRHVPGPGLDQPVASYFSGARVQQIADERGSVLGVQDAGGAVNISRYDEYGVPSATNRFQYTGQAWMAPGLYNYRARAYAPQLGRFLQTDPIGYLAGVNLYGYVGGDPINWIDPWGLEKKCQSTAEVTCLGDVHNKTVRMSIISPAVLSFTGGDGLSYGPPTELPEVVVVSDPAPSPNFRTPNSPSLPPRSLPPGFSLRVMPQTSQYPNGYFVITNAQGQPVDPATMRPPTAPPGQQMTRPEARARTHTPLPAPSNPNVFSLIKRGGFWSVLFGTLFWAGPAY